MCWKGKQKIWVHETVKNLISRLPDLLYRTRSRIFTCKIWNTAFIACLLANQIAYIFQVDNKGRYEESMNPYWKLNKFKVSEKYNQQIISSLSSSYSDPCFNPSCVFLFFIGEASWTGLEVPLIRGAYGLTVSGIRLF